MNQRFADGLRTGRTDGNQRERPSTGLHFSFLAIFYPPSPIGHGARHHLFGRKVLGVVCLRLKLGANHFRSLLVALLPALPAGNTR